MAKLYNNMGIIQQNINLVNNFATVDLTNLNYGLYFLKIDIDGIVETHHISVE